MTGLPAVLSRAYLSWSLAELGAFAEGTARGDEGVRIAEATDHPFSRIWAYAGIGKLYLTKGDVNRSILLLERALELCQVWDIPTLFSIVVQSLGPAYALSGCVTDAVPLLTQALEQAIATKRVSYQASCSVHLGEVHMLAGRLEEAHALAERALALARERQERGN